MLKSYYEILNISPNASKQEIKNQYKKLPERKYTNMAQLV